MPDSLLIYGATGYTGRLLAFAARGRGLAPVLCGRSEDKLRSLGDELQLEFRVAGLGEPERPFTPWQALLKTSADWLPEGPTDRERAGREAVLVVEVENIGGEVVRSRLRTPEAYSFTALAAPAIAARVLAGDLEPGFQTPARVYGPDFVLSLPRTSREDL